MTFRQISRPSAQRPHPSMAPALGRACAWLTLVVRASDPRPIRNGLAGRAISTVCLPVAGHRRFSSRFAPTPSSLVCPSPTPVSPSSHVRPLPCPRYLFSLASRPDPSGHVRRLRSSRARPFAARSSPAFHRSLPRVASLASRPVSLALPIPRPVPTRSPTHPTRAHRTLPAFHAPFLVSFSFLLRSP